MGPDTARVYAKINALSGTHLSTPLPDVLDIPPELWWDAEIRDAVRRSRSRSRSRSTSPTSPYHSRSPVSSPQDPFRPISSIGLAAAQDPILAYKRGGDYFPADEEYHLKRVVVRGLLERAEHRKHSLADDHSQILNLRDEVQGEYQAYANEVHARCSELRAVLEMRESMLMGSLDKLRQQKIKSLAEDAAECRSALDRLQHLCATIARFMDQERDSEVFLAKMAIPEMQLRETLDRSDEWVPEVQVSFGAKLEVEGALQAVQSLDFSYPQEIRGAQGSMHRPLNGAANQTPNPPPMQPAGVDKAKVIKNIQNLILSKQELKARAVAAENFTEAAKLKKEIDALQEERNRVGKLPDQPTIEHRIAKLKEEKKQYVQNENFPEAARCKQEIEFLEGQASEGSANNSGPPSNSASDPDPPPAAPAGEPTYKFRVTTSQNTLDKSSVFYDRGENNPNKEADRQKKLEAVTDFRKKFANMLNTTPSQIVIMKGPGSHESSMGAIGSGDYDVGNLYFDIQFVAKQNSEGAAGRLKKLRQSVEAHSATGTVINFAGESQEIVAIETIKGLKYLDEAQLMAE